MYGTILMNRVDSNRGFSPSSEWVFLLLRFSHFAQLVSESGMEQPQPSIEKPLNRLEIKLVNLSTDQEWVFKPQGNLHPNEKLFAVINSIRL